MTQRRSVGKNEEVKAILLWISPRYYFTFKPWIFFVKMVDNVAHAQEIIDVKHWCFMYISSFSSDRLSNAFLSLTVLSIILIFSMLSYLFPLMGHQSGFILFPHLVCYPFQFSVFHKLSSYFYSVKNKQFCIKTR